MTQRLSVNINDETAAALNQLAERDEVTITEVVRRAISVYKFVDEQVHAGKHLQLADDKNNVVALQLV
jgi:predicted transcriptional regulator